MADSSTAQSPGRGVVYVATGESFVKEAITSALSCRAHMPDIPIHLFTDVPTKHPAFNSVTVLDAAVHRSGDKILPLLQSPFEKTVFLDTDTFICAPFQEVFDLLEHFDLAGAHSPKRMTDREENLPLPEEHRRIPSAFPELNSGVLAFRKSARIDELFQRWHVWYTYSVKRGDHWRQPRDQPSLRVALFESQCRFYLLTPEYNFRFNIPSAVCKKVKILHGRAERLSEIARLINADESPRAYVHSKVLFQTTIGSIPPQASPKILVMGAAHEPVRRKRFTGRIDIKQPLLSAAALRVRRRLQSRVASGPFAELRFLKPMTGMTYYAKLLGTYELELHPVIKELCVARLDRVVNAGAADGYFAVGFASRIPSASVVAFEVHKDRRVLIRELAERNRALSRVRIEARCDPAALSQSLKETKRNLVFMDVEGAEEELLDLTLVPELRSAFVVVEIHESARPGISARLATRFAHTHALHVISMRTRRAGDFPLKNSSGQPLFKPSICLDLMNENRAYPVGWLYLRPNQPVNDPTQIPPQPPV